MRLEPALFSFAALACLALTGHRVRRDLASPTLPDERALRIAAVMLLLLATWRAVHHFGPYQGPVAMIGLLCAAGIPLVLLLSCWPRASVVAGIGAGLVALGTTSLSFTG